MKRFVLPLIALGLALLVTQVAHAESATVRISPASQTVAAGQNATVDLQVESVTDPDGLGSYGFALDFDPDQLDFVSVTNGAFLGSTGRDVLCLPPTFDRDGDGEDDPGYVRYACLTQGQSPPGPTGNGTLATVVFDTLCASVSTLEFDPMWTSLSDPLGGTFDLTTHEGTITTTGTPCAPPVVAGDANCDGQVTAVDAALILQLNAGLITSVECPEGADANGDGEITAVDAALVLQFVAGLIDEL